jgi:hypothetical protein
MGNARARGTFETRKRQAIAAGRIKTEKPKSVHVLPTTGEMFAHFMALIAPRRKAATPTPDTNETKPAA